MIPEMQTFVELPTKLPSPGGSTCIPQAELRVDQANYVLWVSVSICIKRKFSCVLFFVNEGQVSHVEYRFRKQKLQRLAVTGAEF